MLRALSEYHIAGLINNINFLKSILKEEAFQKGAIDINYIERNINPLLSAETYSEHENAAALLVVLLKTKQTFNGNGKTKVLKNGKTDLNKWSIQQYE
jgi:acetyl/propionyl-CoA carboxylase alpha subunit